jgi:hypothetical protein
VPNPTILPNVWAPNATFTVNQTNRLIVDIHISGLASENAQLELEAPAGATIELVRDPASWTAAGTAILTGGVWSSTPVPLGNWSVVNQPGVPRVVEVSNASGTSPTGVLRLVVSGLAGAQITLARGGGGVSIDRLLADPSINNVQVTSGTPVEELDVVQLSAALQATSLVNTSGPFAAPINTIPAVTGVWKPRPTNAVAVKAFNSSGSTATFKAPAVYAPLALDFDLQAALDLASNGTVDPGDPANTGSINVPIATVKHRMVLVLDRSGSMFGTKWDSTTQAAHAWVDLFRALRPGADHKAGIVTFEHDPCGWSATPADDISLRDPSTGNPAAGLSALDTFADVTTVNLGPVQTCTPIGDALVEALQVIETGEISGTKGSIVLLTDGYENSGLTTLAPVPPAGVQTLVSRVASWPGQGKNLVGDRVFTLAVGSSVDEDRLNGLPAMFGQTQAKGYYRLTNDIKEILPAFANMLGEVLDAEQILPFLIANAEANTLYFQVPKGEQRVVFLVPWADVNDEVSVMWRSVGDTVFNSLLPTQVVVSEKRGGHGIIGVDVTKLPATATEWRVQHLEDEVAQPLTNADVVAVRDLHTSTEITLDRDQYFIGDPIRLTCSIRSGGAPVTGATVLVDIARPGEGLGTFLATNSGKVQPDGEGGFGTKPSRTGDPDQGKGLLFKALLEATGQETLPVVEQADLRLFDDGAHGDGPAGNGDYSNSFTDTLKEGTYTFRFRVTGELPDGSPFSRLFVRSTWVGVRPDATATVVIWQIGSIVNGLQQATLTFTPKTASGELLGPYREHAIDLTVWNATLVGNLAGELDGSYVQTIEYQPGDTPIVVPAVYDEPLTPTGPTIDGKAGCLGMLLAWLKNPFTWLVLGLLVILLLVLILS